MTTPDEARAFLRTYLKNRLDRAGVSEPGDDFSLTDGGVIDSFGLLDVISAAEKQFSVQIDVDGSDMDDLSTFGGLARVIANGT